MTLNEYKESSRMKWHDISRELTNIMASFGCHDKLYDNRLNRLRKGSKPTKEEVRALLIMTKNKVDSFNN